MVCLFGYHVGEEKGVVCSPCLDVIRGLGENGAKIKALHLTTNWEWKKNDIIGLDKNEMCYSFSLHLIFPKRLA